MKIVYLCAALFATTLAGCGHGSPPATPSAASQAAVALSPAQQKTYDGSCKTCHSVPASGAPQVGNTAAWAPRLAQGKDVLIGHVINGYQKMPPMGLCMECGENDFVALTEYMSGAKLP